MSEQDLYRVMIGFPDDALTATQRSHLRTRLAARFGGHYVSWSTQRGLPTVLRLWLPAPSDEAAISMVSAALAADEEARADLAQLSVKLHKGVRPPQDRPGFYDGVTVTTRHNDLVGEARLDGHLLTCKNCDSDCGWEVSGSGTRASDFVYTCEHCGTPAEWRDRKPNSQR